jgi:hypothetical protein
VNYYHRARQVAANLIIRWTAALLWTLLTTYLMVWPSRGTAVGWLSRFFGGTEVTDAIGHVILTSILAWLWYRALHGVLRPAWTLGVVLIICLGLEIVTEFVQAFIPSRDASTLDVLANVLGVGLSLGIIGRHRGRPASTEC